MSKPLCVNCKHHVLINNVHLCKSPHRHGHVIELVTGKPNYALCIDQRKAITYESACSEHGAFFEPNENPEKSLPNEKPFDSEALINEIKRSDFYTPGDNSSIFSGAQGGIHVASMALGLRAKERKALCPLIMDCLNGKFTFPKDQFIWNSARKRVIHLNDRPVFVVVYHLNNEVKEFLAEYFLNIFKG